MKSFQLVAIVVASLTAGCGSDERAPGDGGFRVATAALSVPGISDARYTLRVLGVGGVVVWSSDAVGSAQYGDGRGAVSYVAPCDSTLNPHTVELTLTELWANGKRIPESEWVSPGVLVQQATCLKNADVPVSFDLVVARSAEQGFFDIAVAFDDIFCSAKFDCQDALLHNPAGVDEGAREATGVLAFACAAGTDQDTYLHMTDVRVVCDDGSTTWVSPSGRDGQAGNMGPKPPSLFQTAVYWGHENVLNADKCYWNLALGLGSFPGRCVVEGAATATSFPLVDGALPTNLVYPYVKWQVPLTDAGGGLVCGAHALNAQGSGVSTEYARGTGGRFETTLTCKDNPTIATPPRLTCDGRIGVVGSTEVVAVSQDVEGVSLIMGSARSRRFTLPTGFGIDACCLNPCCAE